MRFKALTDALPAGFDALDAELVRFNEPGSMRLGGESVSEPPLAASADPKYLVVSAPDQLRYHNKHNPSEYHAAEALAELTAAGARPLPVLQAELFSDRQRRNLCSYGRRLAFGDRAQQRNGLLWGLGGVYAKIAETGTTVGF